MTRKRFRQTPLYCVLFSDGQIDFWDNLIWQVVGPFDSNMAARQHAEHLRNLGGYQTKALPMRQPGEAKKKQSFI